MTLENVRPFGKHKPGDLVVVPDGVGFDHYYFKEVVKEAAQLPEETTTTLEPEED